MFNKITHFVIDTNSMEILDGDLIKTAAVQLPDGIKYDPDFFYMKVRAVSAGEYWGCNKNFDYFPEKELLVSYKTFLQAHAFKNHENKDIANAIGDVLGAEWDDKMKSVILLIRIDRRVAPTVVRGFEKGFMTDVSMGCRIQHSVCSICGNKAKTKFEYCEHIKYMRGKILDNGKKVYEINIGPKFHDISAVLNGAERSAKAVSLFINGDKVAFVGNESDFEKVASMQESFADEFNGNPNRGICPTGMDNVDDLDIFEKKASKKIDYIQKVAEIKKEIQGKIIGIAKNELMDEKEDSIESVAKILKLLYTKYWDREKCEDIADLIAEIAEKRSVPLEVAFDQFLKVSNFAGIEISPLELNDIYYSLIRVKVPDLRSLNIEPPTNPVSFMNSIDRDMESNKIHGVNIPSLFQTIRSNIIPNSISVMNKVSDNPGPRIKAVIIKTKREVPQFDEDIAYNDIMHNIVSHLMPERSNHRRFLLKRFSDIAQDKIKPNHHNHVHFMPSAMMMSKHASTNQLPFLLSAAMHANYENERVAHTVSDDFEYGLTKFASYIEGDSVDNMMNELIAEKVASKVYSKRKAVFLGIPATYAYSALQRARINEGHNVNSANRYVAENPGNAALVQAIALPRLNKKLVSELEKANGKLVGKYASDSFIETLMKTASFENDTNILYSGDIFKDKVIDINLGKIYNNNQVGVLKQACLLDFMDRQDLADETLSRNGLNQGDVEQYLKTAKDSIKIEIEKNAGVASGALLSAVNQPVGVSGLSGAPGFAVDSMALLYIANKLNKKHNGVNNKNINSDINTNN